MGPRAARLMYCVWANYHTDQSSSSTSTSGSAHRAELTLFPVAHQPCSARPASQRQRQRQPVVSPPVSKQAPSPLWPVLAAAHTHTHHTPHNPSSWNSIFQPPSNPPTSNLQRPTSPTLPYLQFQ
ncbi:predicted protein [Histoplasma capsulatum var. duboisii H88]|uniref:Predicted protein n=1 Tax=Ajellomyces capsulatus (strain H88) TaxID=544711 RepID=F0U8A0_AJEC8|nr:predicted protein [Histoplasma capsulatum var. duboisii H88]